MIDLLKKILSNSLTERFVLGLIILNGITLGLETSSWVMERFGPLLKTLDMVILWIFVAELTGRLIVQRGSFFKDGWNVFDFIVVAIALVPNSGPLSVLRSLRILRVLRLITVIPSLKSVVGALISSLPGMGSIMLLLGLIFYVFGVMATKLFGATHPELFGSLGESLLTLFQVMTLDAWSDGVMRPILKEHPYAWIFFLPFVLITAFTALNLFIGVVVKALEVEAEEKAPGTAMAVLPSDVLIEVQKLSREVADLRASLAASGTSKS